MPCIMLFLPSHTSCPLRYVLIPSSLTFSSLHFSPCTADCTVGLGEYISYLDSSSALEEDNPVYIFETLVDTHHDRILEKFRVPRFFTGLHNTARGCHLPGDRGDLLSEVRSRVECRVFIAIAYS